MLTTPTLEPDRLLPSTSRIRPVAGAGGALPQLERVAATGSDEAWRRRATIDAVRRLLRPRSVAVIGDLRDPQHVGSRIVDRLEADGFTGALFGVQREKVATSRVPTLTSVRELPRGIDLAIVCVAPDAMLNTVDECVRAGVRTLGVMSPAIAGHGKSGRLLQQALLDLVRGSGTRLLGPNCLGVVNLEPAVRLHATWAPILPAPGRFSLASQRGASGLALLDLAAERELGLSSFVDLGNRIDISNNDLLEFWEDDPATHGILLCLESLGNPWRFARIAGRVSASKPIVALKTRSTGCRIDGRYDGALAENSAVVHEIFHQTGVIAADCLDEMVDIAVGLDSQPLPRGSAVAVVTNAVGAGIRAADACALAGLNVAAVSSRNDLFDTMSEAGASGYRLSVEAVLRDPGVDSVIVVDVPKESQRPTETLAAIGAAVVAARACGVTKKPVLASGLTERSRSFGAEGCARIPAYAFPANAICALAKITRYAEWRART